MTGGTFVPGSAVLWNSSTGQPPIATTYVSPAQLTATIPAPDIATAGTASVTVVNPAPGGGSSQAASFAITGTIPDNASFVAPDGSDSNPGTISQPYLTIQKCATTAPSGGICNVRAGTYRETVTPNSGITITSHDGESVTVDGSDPVTGWTLYQGSVFKASAVLSSGDTNQVFVGDQMMTEARWPNGNDLFNVNWATAQAGTTPSLLVDSNLPAIDWTGAKIHLWSGTDPWSAQTGTVTASQAGQLSFTTDGVSYCPYVCPMPGGHYYLFGTLGALDAEREWYYDSTAGMLYLWAPGSADPSTLCVRAKQRQFAFDLGNASNVTIRNINLFASTVNLNWGSSHNTLDGINATFPSQFASLPDAPGYPSSFWGAHTADSGILLYGSSNALENSTVAYSAGAGVAIQGNNNTVANNLIHHTGYMGDYASGINLEFSGNAIRNNTIHTNGRFAICLNTIYPPNNDEISYNNLFNGMILTRDGGEIYAFTTVVTGTSIDHNWIHDTQSHIAGPADNYPLPGVYLDNGASGFEVDQNVLWNNEYYNIFLHGAAATTPNDNNVHNNTIPDVSLNAYISLVDISNCGTTQVADSLVLVPVNQSDMNPLCPATDNSSTAPGATDMTSSVRVGCNFAGCSASGPPTISGSSVAASIAIQPGSVTVSAGQAATFTVTAAGSTPLSYQWERNGVNISGATGAIYTTPATTSVDNGAVFTVEVSNSVGRVMSDPATLTIN